MKRRAGFRLFVLLIAVIMVAGTAACGGGSVRDGKTINIKAYRGGYGTTWLYRLAEEFERVYADEGYKVNILRPDNSLVGNAALSEMRLGSDKSGIDIIFTQSVEVINAIDEEYGVCVENLSEMYAKPAISFDGSEEDQPISAKLPSSYDGAVKAGDDYYAMLYASSPSGMVANTAVLREYGLELPRTTRELFHCYDVIYNGNENKSGSAETGVYPFAWAGNNAYGYALFQLYTYLGQTLGRTEYDRFMTLQQGENITQEDIDNGKEVYDKDAVFEPVELLMRQFNTRTSVPGSIQDTHDEAHYSVLMGTAAFIPDGEYFYSEAKVNYEDYLSDIVFLNTPVNSSLGVALKLDGSGTDQAKCDEILSFLISLYDADKSAEEMIAGAASKYGVTLTKDQVDRVAEARGCYYERLDHCAYIVAGTKVKTIAELFLRMAASDDFGDLFNETAYAYAPYSRRNSYEGDDPFIKSVFDVVGRRDAWSVSSLNVGGLRKMANISLYEPYGVEIVRQVSQTGCLFDGSGTADFISQRTTIRNKINEVWGDKMQAAGYHVSD